MTRKKTFKEFIDEAKSIHGDAYDYSLVKYKGAKINIIIVCKKHGASEQTPSNHLSGQGCKRCGIEKAAKRRSITTERFIAKASTIHGNKYDYSLVNYKSNKTKVEIICPEHGVFEQISSSHLLGQGCRKCGYEKGFKKRSLTTENFVEKSRAIHGEKYDYSLVEYKNAHTKVKIICPEHGIFKQIATVHLRGSSCRQCSRNKVSKIKRHTLEIFVEKSHVIHGNKYDYSLVEYKNAHTKVEIICPEHGVFEQTPANHLNGNNCFFCGLAQKRISRRILVEEIFFRFRTVHGDKYNYSLVEYKDTRSRINIICPKHGLFEKRVDIHFQGSGCPKCSNIQSKSEISVANWLGVQRYEYKQQVKFNDCKSQRNLPFDFQIFFNNRWFLLEIDGRQHREPVKPFGGEKGFKQTQKHDAIKNKYCEDNNIPLLRLEYNSSDPDSIPRILVDLEKYIKTFEWRIKHE